MKKISKRITAFILSLLVAVTIIPLSGLNIKAEAATGDDVVAYARQYLGCPYVSGATGPNAFDCSGFVSFVYSHFGISIPNSTYAIWNNISSYGMIVGQGSVENAKAGDIIVWSGHVAIYTSDGGCIEALNQNYGVTEAIKVNSHTNGPNYYVLRIPGLEGVEIKPEAPVISVNKTQIEKNASFTVSWNPVFGADEYRIVCKSGGFNYVDETTTATTKVIRPSSNGLYSVTVYAVKDTAEVQSNEIVVSVGKFAVKYNANGGSGAPETQYKYYGEKVTLSSTVPVRPGYVFKEWNLLSSGRGTSYPAGAAYDKNADYTLYAIWVEDPSSHTHRYTSKVTKSASCDTEGIRTYTCSCGVSYTEVIPAVGHSFGEWIITELATSTKTGERQHICTRCGEVEKETIAKLPQDIVTVDKSAIAVNYRGKATIMANKDVTWSSSNPSVAVVDNNGNVTSVGTGTAIITATGSNGTTASCVVQSSYAWWQWIIRIALLGFLWY